jgi:hypothetical protein
MKKWQKVLFIFGCLLGSKQIADEPVLLASPPVPTGPCGNLRPVPALTYRDLGEFGTVYFNNCNAFPSNSFCCM